MFARVTLRRSDQPANLVSSGEQVVYPNADPRWRRITSRRPFRFDETPSGHPTSAGALTVPTLDLASPAPEITIAVPAQRGGSVPLLPGEPTLARRAKFALVNGFTVASLVLGMTAVFLAINGHITLAAVALLACVVLDGCDGGLARKFDVASPFGAQMDSLADLSSFGVATGIVVYQWLIEGGASPQAAGPASVLVAVCAAIRLARFNVSPKDGRFFSGVPTTMAAAVLALNVLLGPHLPAPIEVALVAVYAIAMVTSFPYAKVAQVVRLPLWVWLAPAMVAMVNLSAAFVLVVCAYLVSGPVLWLVRRHDEAVLAGA